MDDKPLATLWAVAIICFTILLCVTVMETQRTERTKFEKGYSQRPVPIYGGSVWTAP